MEALAHGLPLEGCLSDQWGTLQVHTSRDCLIKGRDGSPADIHVYGQWSDLELSFGSQSVPADISGGSLISNINNAWLQWHGKSLVYIPGLLPH